MTYRQKVDAPSNTSAQLTPTDDTIHQNKTKKFGRFSVKRLKQSWIYHKLTHNRVARSIRSLKDRCITSAKFIKLLYQCISEKIKERPVLYFFGAFLLPFSAPYVIGRAVETASRKSVLREGGTVGSDEELDPKSKWDIHPDALKIIKKGADGSYPALHAVAEVKSKENTDISDDQTSYEKFSEELFDRDHMARDSKEETQEMYKEMLGESTKKTPEKSDSSEDALLIDLEDTPPNNSNGSIFDGFRFQPSYLDNDDKGDNGDKGKNRSQKNPGIDDVD